MKTIDLSCFTLDTLYADLAQEISCLMPESEIKRFLLFFLQQSKSTENYRLAVELAEMGALYGE